MSNDIKLFFHCAKCAQERVEGISMQEYSRIEAGWTATGLQVRCVRHDLNILNLDFKGQKVEVC